MDKKAKVKFNADVIYRYSQWGEGYFKVNDKGNLCARVENGGGEVLVDLHEAVTALRGRGIEVPLVLRFHDILRHRIGLLHRTFAECIREANYPGHFVGVYPIKVNQMREVVEEIVDAGREFRQGLEAGSKAELLAVLAYHENPGALIVLNGYKDDEYVGLALQGILMGHKVVIVIESLMELERIIVAARRLQIKPFIGIRGRLATTGQGLWSNSSGDQAKFGMSTCDIVTAVDRLREEGLLDSLELFHFHAGSQISDIAFLDKCLGEATRFFVELRKLGAPLQYLDIGGGLAVDYDGTRSNRFSSKNYTLKEYCAAILGRVQEICQKGDCPPPHIITESGRFLTAHHSCIITRVIDIISASHRLSPARRQAKSSSERADKIRAVLEGMTPETLPACFHTLNRLREDGLEAFKLGLVGLEERALIESIYWEGLETVHALARKARSVPAELKLIPQKLSQQYLCNFSVFQSAADSWAIHQLLPIMPIHRLDEMPGTNGTIADITCDSYGRIGQFISRGGPLSSLPLHDPVSGEPYYMGIFLTGAYQDVMGDMHNLFGRLHESHIYADPQAPGGFYIEEVIRGSSKEAVLGTMQYDPAVMKEKVRMLLAEQQRRGVLDMKGTKDILDAYSRSLQSYTYLEA